MQPTDSNPSPYRHPLEPSADSPEFPFDDLLTNVVADGLKGFKTLLDADLLPKFDWEATPSPIPAFTSELPDLSLSPPPDVDLPAPAVSEGRRPSAVDPQHPPAPESRVLGDGSVLPAPIAAPLPRAAPAPVAMPPPPPSAHHPQPLHPAVYRTMPPPTPYCWMPLPPVYPATPTATTPYPPFAVWQQMSPHMYASMPRSTPYWIPPPPRTAVIAPRTPIATLRPHTTQPPVAMPPQPPVSTNAGPHTCQSRRAAPSAAVPPLPRPSTAIPPTRRRSRAAPPPTAGAGGTAGHRNEKRQRSAAEGDTKVVARGTTPSGGTWEVYDGGAPLSASASGSAAYTTLPIQLRRQIFQEMFGPSGPIQAMYVSLIADLKKEAEQNRQGGQGRAPQPPAAPAPVHSPHRSAGPRRRQGPPSSK